MKCNDCGKEFNTIDDTIYHACCDECYKKRINNIGTNEQFKIPKLQPDTFVPLGYDCGWVCPKCGAVMSPNQNFCPFCSPARKIEITY